MCNREDEFKLKKTPDSGIFGASVTAIALVVVGSALFWIVREICKTIAN